MKKLLDGLVHLYPREWRQRYEAEFRALLEDAQPHWKDAFDIAKEGFAMQLRNGLLLTPLVIGVALAEGLQLGLIIALFRRRGAGFNLQRA